MSEEHAEPTRALRAIVSGRVQGVGFRAWTQHEARGLDLEGTVRNLPEGQVEAVLQGTARDVLEMLERFHRGPGLSRVTGVQVQDLPWNDAISGFRILP